MKNKTNNKIYKLFLLAITFCLLLCISACGKKNTASEEKAEQTTEALKEIAKETEAAEPSISDDAPEEASAADSENVNPEAEYPQEAEEIKEVIIVEDEFAKNADSKEISDYHDFQSELGFRLRARIFAGETVLHILNGNVACCQFTLLSSAGETVTCTLKATKDAETAKVMSGIGESDMTTPSVSEFVSGEGRHIELSSAYSKKYGCDVWSWTKDDIFYTITSTDNADPGVISEMMEQCIQATNQND